MAQFVMYTLTSCPVCDAARADLKAAGTPYEERRVDDNQQWLDEARGLGDAVPILVWDDGRIERGWKGEEG